MENAEIAPSPLFARKWWVLVSVGIGTFMSALDGSVVNANLPVITAYFDSTVAVIEWVVVVYLLVVSGLLLSFGRLGDLRGHKRVYITGYILFIISSTLCGLSPSPQALIVFRGVQAIGAAMLFANSPAILTGNFPPTQRGQALGMQAMLTYLGLTAGPSLGGWLAQLFGWRAIFYINVPVGIVGLLACLRFIPDDREHAVNETFDWKGALVFTAGLVTLLFALNQGHAWGWTSPKIILLVFSSLSLLLLFIWVEQHTAAPMLDLGLFRRSDFSSSVAGALLNYVCLYSITFLLPFYLIQGRQLSPARAGLILTAQPLVMMVVAPISGTLSDRVPARPLATTGMLILAVGLWLLSLLKPNSPIQHVALSLAVCGLGTGLFVSPNNNTLLGSAPRARQGIASGILAMARNMGMALGVGLAGAIFTSVVARYPERQAKQALFPAIHWGFVVAAGLAVFGAVISLIRRDTISKKPRT